MPPPIPGSPSSTLVGSPPGPTPATTLDSDGDSDSDNDDINSSPIAALNAAMSAPTATPTGAPKDTLDDPSPFAAPPPDASAAPEPAPPFDSFRIPLPAVTDAPVAPRTQTTPLLDDDDVLTPRSPVADLVATITSSRRNLALVAGGLGVVILASALVFCGGGNKSKTVASTDKPPAETTAVEPTPAEPPPSAPEPTPEPSAAVEPSEPAGENLGPTPEELAAANEAAANEAAANEAAASEAATSSATTSGTSKTAKTGKSGTTKTGSTGTASTGGRLGGKQVVYETDQQAKEARPVAAASKQDQSAIQKARASYSAGNKRLFAGDPASAIKHYREALGYYPGYVAGYRGLGLAYEKQGDKANALKALRTYVSSVPGAKDASLIRKRIAALQKK